MCKIHYQRAGYEISEKYSGGSINVVATTLYKLSQNNLIHSEEVLPKIVDTNREQDPQAKFL